MCSISSISVITIFSINLLLVLSFLVVVLHLKLCNFFLTTSRSSSFVHMHVLHEAVLNVYVRVRTNWHRNICTHGFHRCFCPLDLSIRVNVQIFFFPEKQSKRSWHHPLKESTKPSGLNTKQRHRTQTHAHRHNGKSTSTHTHFL